MNKTLYKILKKQLNFFYAFQRKRTMKRDLKKLDKTINSVVLTQDQKKEIDDYYKKYYGKKVDYKSHKLFLAINNKFRNDYIPYEIYAPYIEPMFNDRKTAMILEDKNLFPLLFGNESEAIVMPSILSCVDGQYRDENQMFITKQAAIDKLSKLKTFVIKKSKDTLGGHGVFIYSMKNGVDIKTGKNYKEIIECIDFDFIVQHKIEINEKIKEVSGCSISTFRITTYSLDGNIYTEPISMRMSINNYEVDNLGSGGIAIGVSDNGKLGKFAYKESGERYERHPITNKIFDGVKFDFVPKMINVTKILHQKLGVLSLLSWDVTINNNNEIVLIECNMWDQVPNIQQWTTGESAFKENTEKILQMIKKK